MFATNPRWLAVAAMVGALGGSTPAEANLFGLFRTRHRPTEATAIAVAPAPVAYAAPTLGCSSCAARPVQMAVAPSACSTCSAPASVQVPETCYENRCQQVPVTRYVTQTQNVPVTEMQRSYVYEPVTTMRTSAYYDPCSCGYYNVATPETTMVRKEVATPVTRFVQQHYQVPVTEMVSQCTQVPVTRLRTYVPAGAPLAAAPSFAQYLPGGMVAAAPQPYAAAPGQIALPNPAGQVVPSAPGAQGQAAGRDPSGYPPAAQPQPRMVERIFQNEKIEREKLYFDQSGNGAPLSATPAPNGGAAAQPQAYHPPADTARVPANGMRTVHQWRVSAGELQTVSLSKPIAGR